MFVCEYVLMYECMYMCVCVCLFICVYESVGGKDSSSVRIAHRPLFACLFIRFVCSLVCSMGYLPHAVCAGFRLFICPPVKLDRHLSGICLCLSVCVPPSLFAYSFLCTFA